MSKNFLLNKLSIRGSTKKQLFAVLAVAIVLMMSISIIGNSSAVAAQTTSGNQTTYYNSSIYGNLSQYIWPSPRGNPSNTGFSSGPAPNSPDIEWNLSISGISGMTAVFNGLVFAESGTTLYAVNATTGTLAWQAAINSTAGVSRVGPTQIDNNYLIVYNGHAIDCFNIATGAFVWATPSLYSGTNSTLGPGGPSGGLLQADLTTWLAYMLMIHIWTISSDTTA